VPRERTVEAAESGEKRQTLRLCLGGEHHGRLRLDLARASALRSKAAVRREVHSKRQFVRRTGPSGRKDASAPAAAFESGKTTPLVRQHSIEEEL
jgi:hypothetical protein